MFAYYCLCGLQRFYTCEILFFQIYFIHSAKFKFHSKYNISYGDAIKFLVPNNMDYDEIFNGNIYD